MSVETVTRRFRAGKWAIGKRLATQAAATAATWRRVAAESGRDADGDPTDGGLLAQISAGHWDSRLGEPSQVRDLTDVLAAAEEYGAQLRRSIDAIADPVEGGVLYQNPAVPAARHAASQRLPFNRKERYYTGTVLPMIAFSDGFAYTDRLLDLTGLPGINIGGLEGHADVQVFTEYSFAESVFLPDDRDRFADRPAAADTPDLVLTGPDWLLAIEAKLFDQPSPADLRRQLDAQAVLVRYWTRVLELDPARVAHVALLPASLARRVGPALDVPIVLWEDVLDAYRYVAPRHWLGVLEAALGAGLYGSEIYAFGANKDATMTGDQIVAQTLDGSMQYTTMGRVHGLHGAALAADVTSGKWRTQAYEVRVDGLPNGNWFTISEFLALIADAPDGHVS